MTEYTPTTEDVRNEYTNFGEAGVAEFYRWLAAHDAEVRAGVVAEEPEWEYRVYGGGIDVITGQKTAQHIADRDDIARVQRRRKAGPWVPET